MAVGTTLLTMLPSLVEAGTGIGMSIAGNDGSSQHAADLQYQTNKEARAFYQEEMRRAEKLQEPFRQGGLYALEQLIGTEGMRHAQTLPMAPSTNDPRVSGPIDAYKAYQQAIRSGQIAAPPTSFNSIEEAQAVYNQGKEYYDRMLPQGVRINDLRDPGGWLANPYPTDSYGLPLDERLWRYPDDEATPEQRQEVRLNSQQQAYNAYQEALNRGELARPPETFKSIPHKLAYVNQAENYFKKMLPDGMKLSDLPNANEWLRNPYPVDRQGNPLSTARPQQTQAPVNTFAPQPVAQPEAQPTAQAKPTSLKQAIGQNLFAKLIQAKTGNRTAQPQPVAQAQPAVMMGAPETRANTFSPLNQTYAAQPTTQANTNIDWSQVGPQTTQTQPQVQAQAQPSAQSGDVPGLLGNAPQREEFSFDKYRDSPWYTMPLEEGTRALERSAIGRGDLYSGQAAQEMQKFGQDYAFSKYLTARQQEEGESMNAFNRWVTGQLNPMQSLLGVGQSATAVMSQGAAQGAGGGSNLINYGGQAQASGVLGEAASRQNMFSNIAGNVGTLGQGVSMGMGNYFNQPEQQQQSQYVPGMRQSW